MSGLLEKMKSKVTWESKTTYGILMIILGFVIWGMIHDFVQLIDIIVIMAPAILLVIPSENVRNNRILGIVLAILLVIIIILSLINFMGAANYVYGHVFNQYGTSLADSYYSKLLFAIDVACIAQIVYSILNLVSAFMLTVPAKKRIR